MDDIEKEVVAILPMNIKKPTILYKEEIIRMTHFYKDIVKDYVGRNLNLDDFIDKLKDSFKCKETKICKKLYAGHGDLVEEDLDYIFQLPKTEEEKSYLRQKKKGIIKESSIFEKDFESFLYLKEEKNIIYLGSFGFEKDKTKKIGEREIMYKSDLIKIVFQKD